NRRARVRHPRRRRDARGDRAHPRRNASARQWRRGRGGGALMEGVVLLEHAHDVSLFGSKAVGLGDAARSGLPLPPGVALSGAVVEAVAGVDEQAITEVAKLVGPPGSPLAGGSSAGDDDGGG